MVSIIYTLLDKDDTNLMIVDAKYFAMADPREVEVLQNKPEEAVFEREDSDSSDDQQSVAEVEAGRAGPSGTASRVEDTVQVVTAETSEHSINNVTESSGEGAAVSLETSHPENDTPNEAENDAVIAAIIAGDIQQMETEQSTDNPQTNDVTSVPQAIEVRESSTTGDVSTPPMELEPASPVDHVYYFIQVFDVEAQALRTVGSFSLRRKRLSRLQCGSTCNGP